MFWLLGAQRDFCEHCRFSSGGGRRLFAKIESILREGQVNLFFNDAIGQLSAEGTRVGFTETEGLPWAEIDDVNDFYYAQTIVYPALKPMMADIEPVENELGCQGSVVTTGALA
jgi:hypothetical protein